MSLVGGNIVYRYCGNIFRAKRFGGYRLSARNKRFIHIYIVVLRLFRNHLAVFFHYGGDHKARAVVRSDVGNVCSRDKTKVKAVIFNLCGLVSREIGSLFLGKSYTVRAVCVYRDIAEISGIRVTRVKETNLRFCKYLGASYLVRHKKLTVDIYFAEACKRAYKEADIKPLAKRKLCTCSLLGFIDGVCSGAKIAFVINTDRAVGKPSGFTACYPCHKGHGIFVRCLSACLTRRICLKIHIGFHGKGIVFVKKIVNVVD